MINSERLLKLLLRVVGAVCVLGTLAVFMPTDWMSATHEWLGLEGEFPRAPIVEYLTRSLSASWAILGGLLIVVASDPVRHAKVITYLAAAGIGFSLVISSVDLWADLPLWWSIGECLSLLPLCLVILVLQERMGRADAREVKE